MIGNYFKVDLPAHFGLRPIERIFPFDDTCEISSARAWSCARSLAALHSSRNGAPARIAAWQRPRVAGPWAAVRIVGET